MPRTRTSFSQTNQPRNRRTTNKRRQKSPEIRTIQQQLMLNARQRQLEGVRYYRENKEEIDRQEREEQRHANAKWKAAHFLDEKRDYETCWKDFLFCVFLGYEGYYQRHEFYQKQLEEICSLVMQRYRGIVKQWGISEADLYNLALYYYCQYKNFEFDVDLRTMILAFDFLDQCPTFTDEPTTLEGIYDYQNLNTPVAKRFLGSRKNEAHFMKKDYALMVKFNKFWHWFRNNKQLVEQQYELRVFERIPAEEFLSEDAAYWYPEFLKLIETDPNVSDRKIAQHMKDLTINHEDPKWRTTFRTAGEQMKRQDKKGRPGKTFRILREWRAVYFAKYNPDRLANSDYMNWWEKLKADYQERNQ